jgi:hypothetical protein
MPYRFGGGWGMGLHGYLHPKFPSIISHLMRMEGLGSCWDVACGVTNLLLLAGSVPVRAYGKTKMEPAYLRIRDNAHCDGAFACDTLYSTCSLGPKDPIQCSGGECRDEGQLQFIPVSPPFAEQRCLSRSQVDAVLSRSVP